MHPVYPSLKVMFPQNRLALPKSSTEFHNIPLSNSIKRGTLERIHVKALCRIFNSLFVEKRYYQACFSYLHALLRIITVTKTVSCFSALSLTFPKFLNDFVQKR